jgi:ankyrin repeat protein
LALILNHTQIDDLRRAEYFEDLVNLCEDVNLTFENCNTGTIHENLLHYVRNQKEAQSLVGRGFSGFNQANSDGKLAIHSFVQCPNAELIQCCLENGSNVNHADLDGRTIIFHLISQLGKYSWLIWDAIDSIKLCLARGADVFLSDSCDCPCLDGNGCIHLQRLTLGLISIYMGVRLDLCGLLSGSQSWKNSEALKRQN